MALIFKNLQKIESQFYKAFCKKTLCVLDIASLNFDTHKIYYFILIFEGDLCSNKGALIYITNTYKYKYDPSDPSV